MKEKCSNCGKEASHFDVNLKSWVCDKCIENFYENIDLDEFRKEFGDARYKEEINNILRSIEDLDGTLNEANYKEIDEKFNRIVYSKDLKEVLESLIEDELIDIAEGLDYKNICNYKGNDLVNLILSNYEEKLLSKLELLDEKTFKALKNYSKHNGERVFYNISDDEIKYIDYFISLGAIFPTINVDKEHVFIMPLVSQNIIEKLNELQYRRKIKNNTKLIKLYIGMIRAYGVLEKKCIIQFVREYLNEEEDEHLIELLREAAKYNRNYNIEGEFVFTWNIDNYMNLHNDIVNEKNNIEYKKFSEGELISLGKYNWETDNKYAKEFKRRFLKYFVMREEEVDEFLELLYALIQEKSLDDTLKEIRGMIQEEEAKEIGIEIIENYIVNLPIWTNKGRSIEEIRNAAK